ncbi:hypothetical protein EL06_28160 [Salmonella enterica subsp. diarizonae]|uniref:Uncharacterized protein n=1 Tax=Salmonella diarizonae TaxID=59204 RepID=A0A6C8Y582_SALDZ|nr:hypothetical protein [Salmonella enterica subsp. diarizonae]
MSEAIKATVRLKKQEAIELKDKAYALTRRAIMNGKHVVYTESDIVHFAISSTIKNIDLDENGHLAIKQENKKS